MGLKAHLMDVETPTGGRDRSKGLHRRRERHSTRGSLAEPYPGGLCHFHQEVGLGRPMTSPRTLMTSSSACGGFGRQLWYMWHVPEAQGGLTFFSRRPTLP
jgi:hypothetical protein